ncbi:MAG: phosphoribosylamine--glycine ligase [Dehalococcoidia bacterium]|nr:phosphoribosylamine--glycine ligase [Dehalococcoidia bacterium]
MKVLVIGSGAREHAIAWKISQSTQVDALFLAPGNAGTAALGTNLPIEATDIPALANAARRHSVDLTIVGPEGPLAAGIVDWFQEQGLAVFGPTRAAAQIEASKGFAKEFMNRHGIPCAQGMAFDSYREAERFLQRREMPVVIKADGLAAGKGVTVALTRAEAEAALDACMNQRVFGEAGARVVVEEFLEGREVSVFAFTDGEHMSPLAAACDYKRVGDGDQGPNTGGMGSYSPPEFWDNALATEAEARIFRPTIEGMAREGRPYRGVLYGGLILTRQGLKVIEFNARLGDPETQVILPRLEADLVEIAQAIAGGEMPKTRIVWSGEACVGVVMASGGYPGDYSTGFPISGLDDMGGGCIVFHSGTRLREGEVVTSGGRVLTVVGRASSLAQARDRAYSAVERIRFQGGFYRRDIALRPAAVGARYS